MKRKRYIYNNLSCSYQVCLFLSGNDTYIETDFIPKVCVSMCYNSNGDDISVTVFIFPFMLPQFDFQKEHIGGKITLALFSIQCLQCRRRPPKPYRLLTFIISFVTTVKSRHAPTI